MNRIVAFICALLVFATPYRLFGFPLPDLMALATAIIIIVVYHRYNLPKGFSEYMIYVWLVPPVISLIMGIPGDYNVSFLPKGLLIFTIYMGAFFPFVDAKQFLKYYRSLVYLAVFFFLFQEISYTITGWRPSAYLPFLDNYYDDFSINELSEMRSSFDRSSSFFLEPAHFMQYIIPYYCIVICEAFEIKKITKELVFLTLVILIARIGNGYIELLTIGSFLFISKSEMGLVKKIVIVTFVIIGYVAVTTFFADNPIVESVLKRTEEFSFTVDATGSQSGFVRMYRGYFIYGSLEFMNKLFGLAPGCFDYAQSMTVIDGIRYEGNYINGIQTLLIYGGVVGTVLFFIFFVKYYRHMSFEGKCVMIALITLFFVESMFYNCKLFLYLLVATTITQVKNNDPNFKITTK